MIIKTETTLGDFMAWSGAIDTQARIMNEGMTSEFDSLIEDLYYDGLDETTLNDLLWFESEWIYENLGMTTEKEEEEDN